MGAEKGNVFKSQGSLQSRKGSEDGLEGSFTTYVGRLVGTTKVHAGKSNGFNINIKTFLWGRATKQKNNLVTEGLNTRSTVCICSQVCFLTV